MNTIMESKKYEQSSGILYASKGKSMGLTFQLLLCFLIITVDSAFYFVNAMPGAIRMVINVFSIVALFFLNRTHVVSNKRGQYLMMMLALPVLSGIITLEIKQTVIIATSIIVGAMFTQCIRYSKFKLFYTKIMSFLAIFSLIALLVYIVFPTAIRHLPIVGRGLSLDYYNAFFSIIYDSSYVVRNFGLFWEPGAFSIFLCIALYLELFERKPRVINVIIYFVTLLSTLSTLGIACMCFLFAIYFLSYNRIKNRNVTWIIGLMVFCAIVYLVIDGDRFLFHVFGKIKNFNVSTTTRIDGFIYLGRAFLNSPIWGIGYTNFLEIQKNYCNDMATFTHINWLSLYGLAGGIIPIIGCSKFFTSATQNKALKIMLAVFSVLLFSTENFIQITFIYILCFYGLLEKESHTA